MKTLVTAALVILNIFWACASPDQVEVQETEIESITVNSRGQVEIQIQSSPDYYYVLYGREDAQDTLAPLSVTLGQSGTITLTESLAAYPEENYVVRQFEVSNPGDLDGDGVDDVEEMNDLGNLSPLNASEPVNIRDGVVSIKDRATFEQLSYKGPDVRIDGHLSDLEFVKFYILDANTDNPRVYFMNTVTHRGHGGFSRAIGMDGGFGGRGRGRGGQPGQMRGEIVYHPHVTAPNGVPGVYRFEFQPNDSYPFEDIKLSYEILAKNIFFLENNFVYYPMPRAMSRYNQEKELYDDSRVAILMEEDLYSETNFIALNNAESYGYLKVMELDERPHPRDIVLYESLPNEMPRVGGIITTVPQTPLSHVNLRAIQDNVPNAYVRSATEITAISDLIGKYVYYRVTEEGYEIREATSAEVESHYQNMRPNEAQVPARDLTSEQIKSLDDISFDEWSAFGVKAANVATMRSFGLPEGVIPSGYAIPFYFYDEFMKHNGLYEEVEEMLSDEEFLEDYNKQEEALSELRDKIEDGDVPEWMEEAFVQLQNDFPEGTPIRCRSSTNNEDLPGFSGAGLYDSNTHRSDEGSLSKTIKEVYASLWNFRAFDEREFYRIDHMSAAMGVLVHPSYSNEKVNGVAVSTDPLYQTSNTFYLNTQLGEDMVTNPNSLSVPEEILLEANLNTSGNYKLVRASNQVDDGDLLMSATHMDELRDYLAIIHENFRELYEIPPGEDFAIEIEYKVTEDNNVAIKQARPWVMR